VTINEARDLIGHTVLWDMDGELLDVRIVGVSEAALVLVQGTGDNLLGETARPRFVRAGELSHVPYLTLLATTQAQFNEFAFSVLVNTRWDFDQTDDALDALRNLNWAAGFDFEGQSPPATRPAERFARDAVLAARRLWRGLDQEAATARAQASSLVQQPAITGPALVYLVAHADLRAVKVGVSEADGSRIAQHRRRGWQLVAAFQVSTGKTAVSIEREVLRWWRTKLGLPACVQQQDMPQGGWTETADAGRVDLAATVARMCELAILPK